MEGIVIINLNSYAVVFARCTDTYIRFCCSICIKAFGIVCCVTENLTLNPNIFLRVDFNKLSGRIRLLERAIVFNLRNGISS